MSHPGRNQPHKTPTKIHPTVCLTGAWGVMPMPGIRLHLGLHDALRGFYGFSGVVTWRPGRLSLRPQLPLGAFPRRREPPNTALT